ncbi:MAG TPA: diacylglycerol kinase family protein [Tepidisphaeraceae bacterium]|jgi:diacylglycerol kinase family enzyme
MSAPAIRHPQGGDIVIFANPISGRGRGAQMAQRLTAGFQRAGRHTVTFLQHADTIPDAQFVSVARASAAIVIGGDGTLRTVAARLLTALGHRMPPLLIVPLGTANLMGRHLGIRWDDAHLEMQVMQALATGHIVHLDAARANQGLCLLVAGVGIDGAIVHELDRVRSGPIRMTSYALPSLLAFAKYDYPPLTVIADGRVVMNRTPAMAFIGNIPEYGTGFAILPHARPDDGLLDLCVIPCRNRRETVSLFLHAAAAQHLDAEDAVYLKARSIRIESAWPAPVQVDGEAAGFTPLQIDLLPDRLPFIVPTDYSFPVGRRNRVR